MASIECEMRDQPITKLVIFNDRAEVRRHITVELKKGFNEVNVNNHVSSLVHDSLRVEGRGKAVIHDVVEKIKPALAEETDSPKHSLLRAALKSVEAEKKHIDDQKSIAVKKIEALDNLISKIGDGVFSHENASFKLGDSSLEDVTKVFEFYEKQSEVFKNELRIIELKLEEVTERANKARDEFRRAQNEDEFSKTSRYVSITVEALEDSRAQLEITYQVYSAGWIPSYDIRVNTEESVMNIFYYGKIYQRTGEDWNNVTPYLSTAQPALGGHIPELGTLEAIFWRPSPPRVPTMRQMTMKNSLGGCRAAPQSAMCMDAMPVAVTSDVVRNALCAEFKIVRESNIPNGTQDHKVTIGIVQLNPKLIHESVPSKNAAAFLTASSINTSELVLLAGEASVYLDSAFVAKTHLKNVSPGERFSCSLGVDSAIKVEYKPAKRYHEEGGYINKHSSNITSQTIMVKNTKMEQPVLLTIKHHVPRSTDEKIKVHLIQPHALPFDPTAEVSSEIAEPSEGAKLNSSNNLEWSVKIKPGQTQELVIKWSVEHPKNEKVEYNEVF
ncbi:unnamed protein product [Caenorhabditis bovis]|uniref:Protein F37C4.5 n=1 Tax=Caenorhabditis bovis TaxID=2654633 RepID=A0A8S1EE71_9PELO|nr:unnamed protein product [Caenorhabditis bovis]